MKLLFDQNSSFKLCAQLADLFPGSSQVRLVGLAEADDRTVWEYAGKNDFMIVSHDADFADLATLFRSTAKSDLASMRQSTDRHNRSIAAPTCRHDRFFRG